MDKINIPIEEMKKVIRVSTDEDYNTYLKNLADAEKCLVKAKKVVKDLNLNMNLLEMHLRKTYQH